MLSVKPMDYEVETDGLDWCRRRKPYWRHLLSAGALTKYHCEHTRPYSTSEVVDEEDCKRSSRQVYEIGEPLRPVTYEVIRGTFSSVVRIHDVKTGAFAGHAGFENHGNQDRENNNMLHVLRMLLRKHNCTLAHPQLFDLCAE